MPLSYDQTESLQSAIANYRFPPEYFDFVQGSPRRLASMKEVEVRIEADLRHGECERVKNGLSNVLYWGYAQQKGRQRMRVARIRQDVTDSQLGAARELFVAAHLHQCSRSESSDCLSFLVFRL